MPQATAYCVEHSRDISLEEAHVLFFAQDSKARKRFNFRCGDPQCRKEFNPLVVGALYDRKDTPKKKHKSPYFREHSKHPHINGCTWINEVAHSPSRAKKNTIDVQSAGSVLNELGLTFRIDFSKNAIDSIDTETGNSNDSTDYSDAEVNAKNIRESFRPETTKFLTTVAARYLIFSEKQRKSVPLSIENICKGNFYNVCIPVSGFHPFYQAMRIYQGKVKVVELTNVFMIRFLSKISLDGNRDQRSTGAEIKLTKKWLDQNDRALAQVLHEAHGHKQIVWCFFYTANPPNMHNGKAQFVVENPNHIAAISDTDIQALRTMIS